MKRYDYRRQYKNWEKRKIESHLEVLVDRLIDNEGICESIVSDCNKKISYLTLKLNNK